jgi:hypothetical protein
MKKVNKLSRPYMKKRKTFALCVAVFLAVSLWKAAAVDGEAEYATGLSWLKSRGPVDGSMKDRCQVSTLDIHVGGRFNIVEFPASSRIDFIRRVFASISMWSCR